MHSITLHNVRGVSSLELTDLTSPGVTVVHGANEFGKSTVVQAVYAALTLKGTSTRKEARELASKTTAEPPRIILDMTIDGYTCTLDKTFTGSSSKNATVITVHKPSRNTLKGGAADDWLAERVKNAGLSELWSAFAAQQGEALNKLHLDELGALSDSLTAITGMDSGAGAAAEAELMDSVEKLYKEWFTPSGNENAKSRAFAKTVAELDERYEQLSSRRAECDAAVDKVARAETAIADLTHKLPTLIADRDQAKEAADRAQELHGQLERAQERVSSAEAAEKSAAAAVAARTALAEQATERARVADKAKDDLAAAKERVGHYEEQVAQARSALEEAKASHREAEARKTLAEFDVRAAADADGLSAAKRRIEELNKANAQLEEAEQALKQHPITAEVLTTITEAETAVAIAEAQFKQSAAAVRITADPQREITVDGAHQHVGAEEIEYHVAGSLELAADGLHIVVESVAGQSVEQDLSDARTTLIELLKDYDIESVSAAREAHAEHLAAAKHRDAMATEREVLRRDHDRDADEALIQRAGSAEEQKEARARTWHGAGEIPEAPADKSAAEEVLAAAAEQARATQRAQQVAEAKVQSTEKMSVFEDQARAEKALENAEAEHKRVTDELSAARAAADDAQLDTKLAEATTALHKARQEADVVAEKVDEVQPEAALSAYEGLAATVTQTEASIHEWQVRRAKNESVMNDAQGLDEEMRGLDEDRERARQKAESHSKYIASVEALYQALVTARDDVRAQYHAPLVKRLREFAQPVFGRDVDFELNDDLGIAKRTLGGVTVDFEELSGGAQEQADLLLRFAAASLLDSGETAPLILDDALGYADPHRRSAMSHAFAKAGEQGQVLVFTCDINRYRDLNARQLDIELLRE
nr:AAA family ATPase [Corynebacterium sp. TAE3-ERU12]